MAIGEGPVNVPSPRIRLLKSVVLSSVLAFMAIPPPWADASMAPGVLDRGPREWVAEADLIVHGMIISVRSYTDVSRGRNIYSKVVVHVIDVIKGTLNDSVLTFEVIGGTVYGLTQHVGYSPTFREKTESILFLRDTPQGLTLTTRDVRDVQDGKVYGERGYLPVQVFIQYLKLVDSVPGQIMTLDSFLQTQPKSAPRLPVPVGGAPLPVGEVFPYVQKQDTQAGTDTGGVAMTSVMAR